MGNILERMRYVIGTLARGLAFVTVISGPFAIVYLFWDWVGVCIAIVSAALLFILYLLGMLVRVERGEF